MYVRFCLLKVALLLWNSVLVSQQGAWLCGRRFCGLFTTSGMWINLPVCVNSFIEQPAYGLQLFFHYQKMALNILCVMITAHTNQCSIDFSLCFFLFSMYSKQLALHSLLLVSAFLHIENPYFFTPCSTRITVPVCALGVQWCGAVLGCCHMKTTCTYPGQLWQSNKWLASQWGYNRQVCIIDDA